MKRKFRIVVLALVMGASLASTAQAQVFVRAPFVRVQVGGGVYVRAPFVNVFIPPRPVYVTSAPVFVAPTPQVVEAPPQPSEAQAAPPSPTIPQQQTLPPQQAAPPQDYSPPQPTRATQTPTLEQFAKTFQPKAGSYQVSIVSPVTNQPTPVRFTLPEGNPRQVHLRGNEIEFEYGFRRFVRIEFDNEGAMVTSR